MSFENTPFLTSTSISTQPARIVSFCCSADDIRDTRSHSARETLLQPFSINMEELTPLDLIFMQLREGGRQEFLELMFHVSRLLNL